MKTIAIKIPEKLDLQLQTLSRQYHISKSRIVRDAIQARLENEVECEEYSAYDLMKDGIGAIKSGCDDLGSNPKHMEGFGE